MVRLHKAHLQPPDEKADHSLAPIAAAFEHVYVSFWLKCHYPAAYARRRPRRPRPRGVQHHSGRGRSLRPCRTGSSPSGSARRSGRAQGTGGPPPPGAVGHRRRRGPVAAVGEREWSRPPAYYRCQVRPRTRWPTMRVSDSVWSHSPCARFVHTCTQRAAWTAAPCISGPMVAACASPAW